MFYYYGAKNMMAKHYPPPKHKTIIEPFSGSGAYSCFHLMRDESLNAILIDKDKEVSDTWNFLLECSVDDILNFPKPDIGEYTTEFLLKTCSVSNASSKCIKMKFSERMNRVFEIQKRRICKLLCIRDRISFIEGNYTDYDNVESTWFIDPPYQIIQKDNSIFQNGNGYSRTCSSDSLSYEDLGSFCKSRIGQTIVCEKEGSDWLPFSVLKSNKTSQNRKYNEMIWTKE
jgi:hypothetical protein